MTVEVSIKETSRGCYRLTFNGQVLGDSRGYSREAAERAAVARVERGNQEGYSYAYRPLRNEG